MDLERKKELLRLVDSMGKDINNNACGNYMPKVINAVEIGMKYKDKDKFKKALEGMKKSSFGGNSEKNGYCDFVDNIMKKREYKIDFLDLDELMFVFSWLRRVVKTKADNKKDNSGNQNRSGYYGNRSGGYGDRTGYGDKSGVYGSWNGTRSESSSGRQAQNNMNRKNYNNDGSRRNHNSSYNNNYQNKDAGRNRIQAMSNNEAVNDNPFAALEGFKEKLEK